ncbi:MAG: lysine--tRNA ligase [Bacilli bacterium]
MEEYNEQQLVRISKIDFLKEKGIEPFGNKFVVSHFSDELFTKYDKFSKEKLEEMNISTSIAGRIMTKRGQGKVVFAHIKDKTGKIQIYVRKDTIGEESFEIVDKGDLGDIIGVEGTVFKTNHGELSIKVSAYTHLVKSLSPLPEKFHGLTDIEERYRNRHVDLIMNDHVLKTAFTRSKIIRFVQNYLDNKGYTEVETPVLGHILGGASAKPFITHFNALHNDMYLRIATELPLKKLLVGGMDAVYEIGRLFRNEGVDRTHNPEFTTIELYKAFANIDDMMELATDLISTLVINIRGESVISWKGESINFNKENFKSIHMCDLIKEETGVDFFNKYTKDEVLELVKKFDVEIEDHYEFGHIVNAFFEKFVEDKLIQPTFVYGHPIEISPLARKNPLDERFTERFELFIGGDEYANAFTELNDPLDQKERFIDQMKQKDLGNDEANEFDYTFIDALMYGMPPAGGMGIGIDRLVMLLTNNESIREVILFPHLKTIEKR